MAKRLLDIAAASFFLVVLSPLLLAAAAGVKISSRGPVMYRAVRVGRDGRHFIMFKFRTMRVDHGRVSAVVTGQKDRRIFPFGSLLRVTKVDELPQLFNILRGDMSFVGPRPEDPMIVERHYTAEQMKTLAVLPGLASPGSIYHYTHGHLYISDDDPERSYTDRLLPLKLALDGVYVRERSLWYDVRIVGRTILVIAAIVLGKRNFADPPEMKKAGRHEASF
jgi:lipopolysaccharide/colanic/teichoic acid biosynthesis glycosyltransferase